MKLRNSITVLRGRAGISTQDCLIPKVPLRRKGAVVNVTGTKVVQLLLLLLNAYRLFVTGSQSTRPVFASLPRIRRVMLDLEGVERPATVCSSSKETRFAIAVTWEGAVVQLDPSPVTQGWLGLLSR